MVGWVPEAVKKPAFPLELSIDLEPSAPAILDPRTVIRQPEQVSSHHDS